MQSQKAMMLVLGILCSDLAQGAVNLLWRHETGEQYQHPFSQPLPAGDFLPQVKQPWQLAAIGDFNGNGEQDLFWYRPDTGQTAFEWFAANGHQSFSDFTSISDSQWQVAASADFDGDGQADLLWRHSTSGLYYLWLMAGANISQQAALFSVTDPDWRLAVAADMDGDGRADLLFRHQKSGDNYQFLMQGSQILSQQFVLPVADLNWQLVASADLNGDKTTDLIWRHQQSGQNYGWYLKAGQLAGEVELPRVADLHWQLRAAFDANAKGEACQLWQHKTQQQLVELCSSNGELRSERSILTAAAGWQWSGLRYSRPGYRGEPHPVPGRIEAEQYDRDGPGLAFHDNDDRNQGNANLRADGVDIEATSDSGGGFNIGYIGKGEWLKYRVQVAKTGHYKLRLRVAGDDGTGQLHLQQGEQNLTGPVSVAATGGWQAWQTIDSPVFELTEGEQSLKLKFDIGLFNLNYFELVEATDSPDQPLAAPAALAAKREGSALRLTWQAVANASSYRLERRHVDDTEWTAFNLTATSYLDSGLVLGQSYQYRVQAQAAGREAQVSAPVETLWRGDLQAGQNLYAERCAGCHAPDGSGGSANQPLDFQCVACRDLPSLADYIQHKMPKDDVGSCDAACAQDTASFISSRLLWGNDAPWPLEVISQPRSKAYPGLDYDYRMAVIGGVFPYRFSLTTAPAGMSISADNGLIRWKPETEGQFEVVVKVEDSQNKAQTKAFSIQVTKTGFYFIAENGLDEASRSGSIDKPWRSLGYAFSRGPGNDAVLYLRAGNYTQASLKLNDSTPVQLLAYPDEKPVIDMAGGGWAFTGADSIARFEGLEFFNMKQYGIWTENNKAGMVVRNSVFRDGFEDPNVLSENPAFIHAAGHQPIAAYHKHFVIQDNLFKNFRLTAMDSYGRPSQTSGAVVYFDVWYSLFEDNQVINIQNQGVVDKDNSYKNTYRKNYITGSEASGINVIGQYEAHQIAVHHNLLDNVNLVVGSHGHKVDNIHVHHNTLVNGSMALSWGVAAAEAYNIRLDHNLISYELSSKTDPVFWGNLTTLDTWYFAPMKGHFSSDHNLLFSHGPYLFGANPTQGARIDEFNLQQLQSHQLEQNSLEAKAGLTGSGPSLGLPVDSPFYRIYGHQY